MKVDAVPTDLGANRLRWCDYFPGYLILMTWALEQSDSQYVERLLQGPISELICSTLQVYIQEGQHQRLSKLLLRIKLAPETWLKLLRAAVNAVGTKETPDHTTILDILLSHNGTGAASILSSIDDIISSALRSKMSLFLLDYLMQNPMFPARRDNGQISSGWFAVIQNAIGQNKFVFLRKLLADWEAFKKIVDLATVENIHIPGAQIPVDCRKQFYIVQAIEAHYNVDVVWLLVGRTTLFRTFKDVNFRNSYYGKELTRFIPELDLVEWTSGRHVADIMAQFINLVYVNHPENIAAQTTALLSSTWKMSIEDYLKEALDVCSFPKIRATMRAGKLRVGHLPLIHMSPCMALDIEDLDKYSEMVELDKEIDLYLGAFDPPNLCYRNEGPVFLYVHVILSQVGWRARHQLVTLISGWKTMGNMAVLRALDQILISTESDNRLIGTFPSDIAHLAREDPASILDIRVAWILLSYYAAHGHAQLLTGTIDRLPLITKCNCALICANSPVVMGPLNLSIESDTRLYEFLRTETNIRGGTVIPKFVLTLVEEDRLQEILVASSKETRTNLLRMVLDRLGEDLSELVWIRALCFATPVAFNLLFDLPRATRLDWIDHHSDLIDKHVLVPALKDDNQFIASQILHHKQFYVMTKLQQEAIIYLAAEHKWSTLTWFIDLIDWENIIFSLYFDNAMLDAVLGGGKKRVRLVEKMMGNKLVFRLALSKPLNNRGLLSEMFPQLIDIAYIDPTHKSHVNNPVTNRR